MTLNSGLTITGIAAAGVTVGLSLVLTLGGIGMLCWDGVDLASDLGKHIEKRRRVRALLGEIDRLEEEAAAVLAEIERRSR